jgi:hypothetical protein
VTLTPSQWKSLEKLAKSKAREEDRKVSLSEVIRGILREKGIR